LKLSRPATHIKKHKARLFRRICGRYFRRRIFIPLRDAGACRSLNHSRRKGSILWGILLLLLYSVGHGILAVIAGTSMGFVRKLSKSERYAGVSTVLKIIMGALILLIGFYMFYLGF
jgi:hypothetical protein